MYKRQSQALLAALEQQTAPAVLATIVGRHGSTPREEGSKMLVLPDGSAAVSYTHLDVYKRQRMRSVSRRP